MDSWILSLLIFLPVMGALVMCGVSVSNLKDDKDTYKLFSQGKTIGVFQFESSGMREYLKQLKPTQIGDLIAMNALYRPGPMQNIPEFIKRKHGRSKIKYLHPLFKSILEEIHEGKNLCGTPHIILFAYNSKSSPRINLIFFKKNSFLKIKSKLKLSKIFFVFFFCLIK